MKVRDSKTISLRKKKTVLGWARKKKKKKKTATVFSTSRRARTVTIGEPIIHALEWKQHF
jgi:hypothetical protein